MFRRMTVYGLFYTFKIKEGTQARLHEGEDWVTGWLTGLCVLEGGYASEGSEKGVSEVC